MKTRRMRDWTFPKWAIAHGHGPDGRPPRRTYDLVIREMELPPGARVLDVGCGTGAFLQALAGGRDIAGHGVDLDPNMVAQATKNCPQMEFSVAPSDRLPFADRDFDVLVVCMAFHHFGNKPGFAREAARVLRPGGMLYIAEPGLPKVIRNTLNKVLRIVRVHGGFVRPQEIESLFAKHGFAAAGTVVEGHTQLVKLRRGKLLSLEETCQRLGVDVQQVRTRAQEIVARPPVVGARREEPRCGAICSRTHQPCIRRHGHPGAHRSSV